MTQFYVLFVFAIVIPYLASGISCPTGFKDMGSYCAQNKLTSGKLAISDAEAQCAAMNATLPTFINAAEFDQFRTFLGTGVVPWDSVVWIGYFNNPAVPHNVTNPGIWLDQSGTSCPYIKWAQGEPNDDPVNVDGHEYCTAMKLYAAGYGYAYDVNDQFCSASNFALCTWRPNPIPGCPTISTLSTSTSRSTTTAMQPATTSQVTTKLSTTVSTTTTTASSTTRTSALVTTTPLSITANIPASTTTEPGTMESSTIPTTEATRPAAMTTTTPPTIILVNSVDLLPVVIAILAILALTILTCCCACCGATILQRERRRTKKKSVHTQTVLILTK